MQAILIPFESLSLALVDALEIVAGSLIGVLSATINLALFSKEAQKSLHGIFC